MLCGYLLYLLFSKTYFFINNNNRPVSGSDFVVEPTTKSSSTCEDFVIGVDEDFVVDRNGRRRLPVLEKVYDDENLMYCFLYTGVGLDDDFVVLLVLEKLYDKRDDDEDLI